jgi:hypothetical protein
MKLTNSVIKQFEQDQKTHGTKTALYNVLWCVASDLLTDLGVKSVKTTEWQTEKLSGKNKTKERVNL